MFWLSLSKKECSTLKAFVQRAGNSVTLAQPPIFLVCPCQQGKHQTCWRAGRLARPFKKGAHANLNHFLALQTDFMVCPPTFVACLCQLSVQQTWGELVFMSTNLIQVATPFLALKEQIVPHYSLILFLRHLILLSFQLLFLPFRYIYVSLPTLFILDFNFQNYISWPYNQRI